MKGKDYTGYSVEQLLEDDFFLKSYFYPTDNSQAFWKEQALRDEVLAKEIVYAQMVLRSIPYRKQTFSSEDKELLWKRISKTNHKKRSFRYWYSSVAAVAILLLTVGSFYYMNYYEEDNLTAIEKVQKPEQPVGTVLLILADEKKVDIEEKNSHLQYNKKGELHINARKMKTSQDSVTSSDNKNELIYNQLIVPSARRSFLELADGSKIWVNANTRVVYPVTFDDKKREIYVDGEIYIGVSVVLVSGKVNVRTDNRVESLLTPSDRLSYEKGTTDIKKVNVENYISWKEGYYTFDNECFSVVLDKLSDYYGKKIRYNDKVRALRCSGSLNLDEDMVKVLTGLESTMPVTFTIEREYILVIVKP